MPNSFRKPVKIGLLILLPFFFTSYISPLHENNDPFPYHGEYNLRILGSQNQVLTGDIDFETALERSADGTAISTLNLRLRNDQKGIAHSFGFLISRQQGTKAIAKGTYRISGQIDGFFNSFDGVFAFANIEAMGELPFFAKHGNIYIADIGTESLRGSIEVKLENPEGKLLNIKGKFIAVRRRIE